jgi:hypothetical protein
MKNTHLFALTLAAALTVAPTFAQQDTDKPAEPSKAHQAPDNKDKDKAAKPEHGSTKTQEAGQEKTKSDARDSKSDAHDSRVPQSDREPGVKNDSADRKNTSRMPQSDQEPATQSRDTRENHEQGNRGEASQRDRSAQYHFKGDEKVKLRSSYKGIDRVNRSQRVTIVRQQVLPVEVQTRIEPVPVEVAGYLPPAPEGFAIGFLDGYCVVYDPNTFFVLEVLDLD